MRKPKTKEPSLRDKLSQMFDEALLADFAIHRNVVIETLRQDDPGRYAELVGKRIMAAEPRPDGFEQCESHEEIAVKLLKSVGFEQEPTQDMIEAAIRANDDFVERLGKIAQGH